MFRLIDRLLCGVSDCECAASIMRRPHWGQLLLEAKCLFEYEDPEMCADPNTCPALPLRVSSPLPLMTCVTGTIMAHGDTEVARDDVADVTIIPATKDGDADTKRRLHPEPGKSNRCVNVVHALNIRVSV
jgi:hypothetical protein